MIAPSSLSASVPREFALGAVHALPVVAGAVPFGLLLGSVAAKAGLFTGRKRPWETAGQTAPA